MELQKFTLHDVNTELLRKLLGISMSVKKSETLNFKLTPEFATGIANNESDSIYKRWSIKLSDLCDVTKSIANQDAKSGTLVFPELKCSIYKGEDFSRKILSFFGQFVNFKIEHDGKEVKKIELFKTNEAGVIVLQINLLTAATATAFVDYSSDLLAQIFTTDETTKVISFELDATELSSVSKLSRLSTNPESQTNWVTLYSDNGSLKATDKAFDVLLKDGVTLSESIDIDKALWSMIDKDKYTVSVHNISENKILVCESLTKDVTISLVLLGKTDTDIDFSDFENTDETW